MPLIESFNKTPIKLIMSIPTLIIGVLHLTIGFLRKELDFDIYTLFNPSLFYDFSLSDGICKDKEINVFHTWGGWIQYIYSAKTMVKTIHDKADITKTNGKYFCYKNIPYLDLLNNGQIIKNGTECPE